MAEHCASLDKNMYTELKGIFEKIHKIKSVKRMTRMLHRCKELVMSLEFNP
jgi:hypothetical protein